MKTWKHPLVWIVIVIGIVILTISYFESREDVERQKTKQMEFALKLEQLKIGATNAAEMIINKGK